MGVHAVSSMVVRWSYLPASEYMSTFTGEYMSIFTGKYMSIFTGEYMSIFTGEYMSIFTDEYMSIFTGEYMSTRQVHLLYIDRYVLAVQLLHIVSGYSWKAPPTCMGVSTIVK